MAQSIVEGQWQGNIHYNNATIPFEFSIVGSSLNNNLQVVLINGSEELVINHSTISGDSIFIPMHAFDATIKAKLSGNKMTGLWIKNYKDNWSMAFSAQYEKPRFETVKTRKNVLVEPIWNMTFKPEFSLAYPSVGYFKQKGQKITGTIAAEVGDLRFFEGVVTGDSLKMSSFDGAHAFLLLGKKTKGKWQGTLIFDDDYEEPWEAFADKNASLTDPFVVINAAEEEKTQPYYDILTAGSGFNILDQGDFEGKVTIIQLLGSWCPNSLDETNYLVEWYKNNKGQKIEVLAVFFEMHYTQEYGLQRIEEYKTANKIPYITALGGKANKGQAALAFPFINKIEAFPTLIIIDKKGHARYMHTYFLGPATGALYADFDTRFRAIIDELLAE